MIRVGNLHKSFGDLQLFRGINLNVGKGEVVVLIGPSGSGKSTFLRCINGLEPFQDGNVLVDGSSIRFRNPQKPSRKEHEVVRQVCLKIGMVFQQFNLFPHMTILENIIEAPIRVLRVPRIEAQRRAEALLKRVNLEKKASSYPEQCSGGEQQRAAIARALAMKPEAMLFDEPTSSLDPELVGEVLSVIKDLVREGMTTLIATHEMAFAREIASRIVVFDEGDIVEEGTPEEIFTNPKTARTQLFLRRILQNRFTSPPSSL